MESGTVTLDELRQWPAIVSLPRAGAALGIGKTASYDLARADAFPVPVFKFSANLTMVRTVDLVRFLSGADDEEPAA